MSETETAQLLGAAWAGLTRVEGDRFSRCDRSERQQCAPYGRPGKTTERDEPRDERVPLIADYFRRPGRPAVCLRYAQIIH